LLSYIETSKATLEAAETTNDNQKVSLKSKNNVIDDMTNKLSEKESLIQKQQDSLKSKDKVIDDLKEKLSKAETRFLLQADAISEVHGRLSDAERGIQERLDVLRTIKSSLIVGDIDTQTHVKRQTDAETQIDVKANNDVRPQADASTRRDVETQTEALGSVTGGSTSITDHDRLNHHSNPTTKDQYAAYAIVLIDGDHAPVCHQPLF
jgi:hypothetical protein